jgi:hypothetical protein
VRRSIVDLPWWKAQDSRCWPDLLKLHAVGEYTFADLAELFAVFRPTVYRVLERASPSRGP